MSALCHVTPYLNYSALSLLVCIFPLSITVPNSFFSEFLYLTDFETCLLELLQYKDCITPRQSWLFLLLSCKQKQKKDKTKLENITIIFYSIMHNHPFFHYTTFLMSTPKCLGSQIFR